MKRLITCPCLLFIFFTIFSGAAKGADLKLVHNRILTHRQKDTTNPSCRESECRLFVHVNKSKQTLYLHIDGVLTDSFSVSTGKGVHETPDINTRPSGPMYKKYTSRKYPGGNYQGLGNMPYVVFVKGGYAIHGTTPGNF